jgi:hypothetical protein
MLPKIVFVGILKVSNEKSRIRIQDPDPNLDPLVRVMDPRIRIHSKMSWIQNTGLILLTYLFFCRRKPCQILLYLSSIFAEGILVKLYRTSLLYLRIRYRTEMLDARMPMKMKLKVPTEDFAGSSVIMVVFNVCHFLFVPPPHDWRREHCSPSRPGRSRRKTPGPYKDDSNICYYHTTYGDQARKCKPGCQ